MMNRWVISTFLLLSVCVAISAQSAGQKALLADPRYQKLQKTIDELRNSSAPDSVRKPTVGEGLRQTLQQLYAVEDLLDTLKKEADACGHCQPQKGKYEEFEKQTEPLRDMMHSLGIPDRETLGRAVEEYLTHRAPTISEDQADEAERQNVKAYADRHCHALYEPLNRLQALSGAEKQEIGNNTKNWFVFARPWVDRLKACLAQVNPEVLWAQHRYALIQCFNAHDYDQLNRSAAPYAKVVAEHQAYDACMNEKDILTAFCTQDRYISFWVAQRREPRRPPPPAQPCPGPDLALMPDPQSTSGTLARTYRAKGSKPETVDYWAQRAAGATPASMGLDITMPPPTYALRRAGEPVNASGVPVGAKVVVSTAESIDLLHADSSRLVPARLSSPADYMGKHYLSPGTPMSLRVRRENHGDRLVFVNFSVDSIEVNGQKYPLPVTAQDDRMIELMDAFGRPPAKPAITVLPPQTLLRFVVASTDPANLEAVPFITEDKNLTYSHGVRANVASGNPEGTLPTPNGPVTAALQAASGSDTAAIPGNLALSLVAVEPIDLASADATRRFRAQTTAPVIHQGNILIPAGSDVFLKVMRKQETRGFLHVAVAADYAIIAGRQVPLATTQMMRSVSTGATPRGIPTRPGQVPPPGAPTLPAQTPLNLITVTPQTR